MVMAATPERRAKMLEALRSAGAWLDRPAIASATGKDQLSPNDINHLRDLESEGYIERRVVPGDGIREKFEYRATDKADQDNG